MPLGEQLKRPLQMPRGGSSCVSSCQGPEGRPQRWQVDTSTWHCQQAEASPQLHLLHPLQVRRQDVGVCQPGQLQVSGKRVGRGASTVVATIPSGRPGRLLVLTDSSSKQWFLVDTGSAYSIIPHQSTAAASGPAIMAADRKPISCWGSCRRTLTASGQKFPWSFLKEAVAFPILGADFLEALDLMVDLKKGRLVRAGRFNVPLSAPPPGCTIASIGVVAAGSSSPSLGSPAGGCRKGRSKRPRKAAAAVDPPSPSVDSSTPSVGSSSPSADSSSPPAGSTVEGHLQGRPKPPALLTASQRSKKPQRSCPQSSTRFSM